MPCPHNEITIVQRSQRQSAVAAAAYQSGEKLFCEYDQQVKHYPEKRGIVHNEILLPPNAPQEYADRNTLWNAAEAVEKQWNSQLARRWVLTIPREIPPDQYAVLVREFCQKQFVSKGMIADFAIHDPHPPGHNPHAHVMLTMRAIDEHGKWLPKSRKVNALYQKSLRENPQLASNPISRWQQKQAIKKEYAAAKRAGNTAGGTAKTASKTAKTVKEKAQQAGAFVMRHKKGFLLVGAIFLLICLLLNTMSSCSMMAQSIGSAISGSTYPSDDPELVAVEADYAARETALQAEIDNIESSHPGYDEYRYDLDMIGHDPHELAAYLSAVLQGYTQSSAQGELERVFSAQYTLTLTEEIQIRTYTDEDGDTHEYEYRILHVKLESRPISSLATELLTPEQLEMYQVYRQTLGNKPLIFGGGSTNTSDSESLDGVEFVNGTRPGNPELVELAKRQVGNVGGQPYWSWYGFNSRVEWCACFVSWCYGQMGLSEPRFAACQSQGIPWFQSHGQWGARGYDNLAPGDAIFFDWDLDGSADHVGIVIGTDGSRVYTVEGNSGDACKIRSYDVNYECIKGYGLMNW